MNWVYWNVWWGIFSNYKGVFLDCLQCDECQFWFGDYVMGMWGESFMFNNGNIYVKWVDDICEVQCEDGCIFDICLVYYNYYILEMIWLFIFLVICDMVYEQFGNIEFICKNYVVIKKWMYYICSEFIIEDGVINVDKYGDWCMFFELLELIYSQDFVCKMDGVLIVIVYYYKVL